MKLRVWAGTGVVAFTAWALLMPLLAPLDARLVAPAVGETSVIGWTLRLIAVLTAPALVHVTCAVVGIWLASLRLRVLGMTMVVAVILGSASHLVIRAIVQRQRPPSPFEDTSTYVNFSFPSGHMTGISVAAGCILVAVWALRLRRRWVAAAVALVLLVALNRWGINAHWMSDIIGGTLLGGTSVLVAAAILRPRRLPASAPHDALVYDPRRVPDWLARRLVPGGKLLPTAADDPGGGQASTAIDAGSRRVFVAGGDGTLRNAAMELLGTGVPLGILPVGSGNILATNIGIPGDLAEAAHGGMPGEIALLQLTPDDGVPRICLTMAGLGASARVLAASSDRVKGLVGAVGYLIAGILHIRPRPFETSWAAPANRDVPGVSEVLVGNVSALRRGVVLLPGASATDPGYEVLVAFPDTARATLKIMADVLARRPYRDHVEVWAEDAPQRVDLDQPVPLQIDGELYGQAQSLKIAVSHAGLTVLMP